ncbi:MAG: Gfo/Idh/MocA family oxidoreductase [Clostridia bacterium]
MKLVIVGVSGYAKVFIKAMFENKPGEDFEVAGYVYPRSRTSPIPEELTANHIQRFDSLEEFYANHTADLVIISSPINLHLEQTVTALRNGSHVLCEKPIAATIQDAREMERVSMETGKFISVGFQWSFAEPILQLKKDILDGVYGKPVSARTVVQWPRTIRYYKRAGWAGKIKDEDGHWVLDSVANNATAHFLHNMFFLLGETIDTSDHPAEIKAEIYRANEIENYDTFMGKMKTRRGVDLLFLASHAVENNVHPVFEFIFEKGKITFDYAKDSILYGHVSGGSVKSYGNPFDDEMRKIFTCIRTIRGEDTNPCPIEAATPQLITINAVSEHLEIVDFPEEVKRRKKLEDTELVYVEGLNQVLEDCYDRNMLPSEAGYSWAKDQGSFTVGEYNFFKGVK